MSGQAAAPETARTKRSEVPEPNVTRLLFADVRMAPLWLVIRLYLGWLWLSAAWGKITDPAWIGADAGAAVAGFSQGAIAQSTGEQAQVSGWYASFLENFVLPNAALFSHLVVFGQILVGLGLIVGLFTGIAAFFGGFMNASFLFAGTAGANPLMFILVILLMLAWRTAGHWGLDRWALPLLGVPGTRGTLFRRSRGDERQRRAREESA